MRPTAQRSARRARTSAPTRPRAKRGQSTGTDAQGDRVELTAAQRAIAFLRNLRRLSERVGAAGVAELIAWRALPETLAYSRVVVVRTKETGELRPDLGLRRLRSPELGLHELNARLAAVQEPGVPVLEPDGLTRGFARGDEAWVVEVDGKVVHARFVGRDELGFAGVSIPLRPDERVIKLVVTLPDHRDRELAQLVWEHTSATLAEEGVTATFGAILGFNRRWLARTLRLPGTRRVATAHVATVGGRRWTRIAPARPSDREMLEQRGLRTDRWTREPRRAPPGARWDSAVAGVAARPYLDPQMAAVKRRAHLDLIDAWVPDLGDRTVLKTDLWEEGVAGDELLFTLARRARSSYGVDVSPMIVASAARAATRAGVHPQLIRADLSELPIADGAIDVVVSTSTIDHLAEPIRLTALEELRRVLSPGGVIVITCDNADNVGDPLLQAAARLGLVPFPLERPASVDDLRGLLSRAGFECAEHAYLVHGPRVLTTASTRTVRLLSRRRADGNVRRLLRAFDAVGRRAPRRMAAFVAVRATVASSSVRPGGARTEVDGRAQEHHC